MTVDVAFNDAIVDLVAANVDVAIRLGWLADSSSQSRRLGTFRQVLVCSRDFAKSLPQALHPGDLERTPWVATRLLKTPTAWTFTNPDGASISVVGKAAVTADMSPAALSCVLAGAGVSVFPDFMVQKHVESGRLAPLLSDWTLAEGGIYAVYPAARFRPAKVKLFVELMIEIERQRAKPKRA